MSKTYRRSSSGGYQSEGGQKIIAKRPKNRADRSSGRYQTAKQRQIVATAVHRSDPDLQRFGRAIIESAMRRAELANATTPPATSDECSDGESANNTSTDRSNHE